MTKIVIQPFGTAPGFSAEPFPSVTPLKVVRSVFSRMADPEQPRRRAVHPLVYALPLEGIIQHAEEGSSVEDFLQPNQRLRSIFGENASANNFRDLPFTIKPSQKLLPTGGPSEYLLKMNLPGASRTEWRGIGADDVKIFLTRQEARVSADKASEIVTLSVMIDTAAKSTDAGFGEFTRKPARKDGPYVATFEVPDFINWERLVGAATPAVEYPTGLSPLDRTRGHLNIVLPAHEGVGQRAVALPGLGKGPA